MPKRIDKLTQDQRALLPAWADKWIEIGLRTGPADRDKFEAAVAECYRHAGLPWHGRVVWVPSPLVMAIAAPTAAFVLSLRRDDAVRGAVRDAVGGAVRDAVRGAVGDAVGDAVDGAVRDAVRGAVRGAVGGAVDGAVGGDVGGAVDGAVRDAVGDAVRGAVDGAVRGAVIRRGVLNAIARAWLYYIGGQFWVGGYYWGPAFTSFFRDACGLEFDGDLWSRGRAYEATAESACWWWPHRDFVMVCERPLFIHRELADPDVTRGWGSHRLHADDGPAIAWPDGWGLYVDHGVRMPFDVGQDRSKLTVARIDAEENAEVKRVMIGWYGLARYIKDSGAELVHEDADPHWTRRGVSEQRRLYRRDSVEGFDEPIFVVDVPNSTREPDGSIRRYMLAIDPSFYEGRAGRECHAAVASTWRKKRDRTQPFFARPEDYAPAVET